MPFQPAPRPVSILASALGAGLILAVAGCGQVTPLGPVGDQPQLRQLGSPIVMQAVRVGRPAPAGGCPAGFTKLSAPGQSLACTSPLGTPVTFTSAAVLPGPTVQPVPVGPGPGASPTDLPSPSAYGLLIAVPTADRAELTAVTTLAYDAQGAVDVSVAGKTWALPMAMAPLTHSQFTIMLPSKNDVLQLQRILASSG
jgi:hypothetical protein